MLPSSARIALVCASKTWLSRSNVPDAPRHSAIARGVSQIGQQDGQFGFLRLHRTRILKHVLHDMRRKVKAHRGPQFHPLGEFITLTSSKFGENRDRPDHAGGGHAQDPTGLEDENQR